MSLQLGCLFYIFNLNIYFVLIIQWFLRIKCLYDTKWYCCEWIFLFFPYFFSPLLLWIYSLVPMYYSDMYLKKKKKRIKWTNNQLTNTYLQSWKWKTFFAWFLSVWMYWKRLQVCTRSCHTNILHLNEFCFHFNSAGGVDG